MKYKVGDTVYLRRDGLVDIFDEVTITRVGRKYAYFFSRGNLCREYAINKNDEWIDPARHYVLGRVIPSIEDYLSTKKVLNTATTLYRVLMGSTYTGNLENMSIEEKTKLVEEMGRIIKIFTKEKQ